MILDRLATLALYLLNTKNKHRFPGPNGSFWNLFLEEISPFQRGHSNGSWIFLQKEKHYPCVGHISLCETRQKLGETRDGVRFFIFWTP